MKEELEKNEEVEIGDLRRITMEDKQKDSCEELEVFFFF